MTLCRSWNPAFPYHHRLPLLPVYARDAADEDIENGLGHALDFGISDAPAREVAADIHAGKAVDQCATGDLDLLQLARAELSLLECVRQHLPGQRWRLFGALTLVLIALSVWIAGMRQSEVEGVRTVIRFTARTSLLFFCLAFSAAALVRLWPNAFTRWQRRNRRQLGVTFAASHALHALAIIAFAIMDPVGYAGATNLAS